MRKKSKNYNTPTSFSRSALLLNTQGYWGIECGRVVVHMVHIWQLLSAAPKSSHFSPSPKWVLSQATVWICALLWSLYRLQGCICSGAWSTSSSAFFIGLGFAGLFLILFLLSPHSFVAFCPFLNMRWQRCHQCHWQTQLWLQCGHCGAVWDWLGPSWCSPWQLLTDKPLQPPNSKTCCWYPIHQIRY